MRTTFTLDRDLAEQARRLDINVSAPRSSARQQPAKACCTAMAMADRAAYQRLPEQPDDFWDDAEAWGSE